MIKKTLTWEDLFTEEPVTRDFYFHLYKADLVELEVSEKGGLGAMLTEMVETKDMQRIVEIFKTIVRMGLGIRQENGDFDKKSDEAKAYVANFMGSAAYDALFTDLTTGDTDTKAIEFITGMMPKDMRRDVLAAQNSQPAGGKKPQDMSRQELLEAFQQRTAAPAPPPAE